MNVTEVLAEIESRGLSISAAGADLRIQGPGDRMDAALVASLKSAKAALLSYLSARPPIPMTSLQRAYLSGRGDPETGGVASYVYHEFEGTWDPARLERALAAVVARHSALRTRFTRTGSQVEQDSAAVRVPVTDLRSLPPAAREKRRLTMRERWSHRILPAGQAPLVAAEVTILSDEWMVLHVGHDGLVMDGISMFLFFADWWAAYSGDEGGAAAYQFSGYIKALAAQAAKPAAAHARDYWLGRLGDLASCPDVPLATAPEAITHPRFTQRVARLAAPEWERVKRTAASAGVTPSSMLLAAYAEALTRWGAGSRFTVNATVAHRPPSDPRILGAVGQFSDTLLVEVLSRPDATFTERARAVQKQLRADLDHRQFSGVETLRELGRRGMAARAPYTFNSTLGYPRAGVDGSALELFGREVYSVSQTPQVWLNAFVMEQHGSLVVQLDSVDELFPAGLPAALAGGYQHLLNRLTDEEAWREKAFDLRPAEQLSRRAAANDTTARQRERPLVEAIMDQASRQPDAPAVVTSSGVASYGELARRAQHAAAWLRGHQVGRDELVGLVMRRGPEQVTGILATALAGGAYLPVDAGLPPQRQAYMLADGRVRCVLANTDPGPALPGGIDVLRLDAAAPVPAGEPPSVPPLPGASPDDLAYVLYTSGTTGEPKGVMVSQRSVANVVADCNARFGVSGSDRFFGISAFNFDLSVYDVFGALSAGAAIVVPDHDRAADPAHWLDLCEAAGVTIWNSVPAIVALLRDEAQRDPGRLAALRLVMMSGDRVPPDLPGRLRQTRPGLEVISLGGPTETTVWNILHPVGPADDGSRAIPYGVPNANNRAYILDADGLDTPDWVPGEICAAGVGLARGYWGDEARTSEKFTFDERRGERLYRTGDLGCYLPSGEIDILGRADFQIKINGYRIEAGEIETRLACLDAVKQAAVVRQQGAHGDRLVAHLAAAGDARPGLDEITERLRQWLPAYMVPTAVTWHDALPLTRNGKVDRAALTAMPVTGAGPHDLPEGGLAVEPAAGGGAQPVPVPAGGGPAVTSEMAALGEPAGVGELERDVAGMWASVLRAGDVDTDTSFYDLGGDSLAAARVLAEIRKRYRVTIPLDALYDVRTVRLMAARVHALRQEPTEGTA